MHSYSINPDPLNKRKPLAVDEEYVAPTDPVLILCDEREDSGITAGEIGQHNIEGEEVRGTHVPGPFKVEGEKKACSNGLILLTEKGLRSYFIPLPNDELERRKEEGEHVPHKPLPEVKADE